MARVRMPTSPILPSTASTNQGVSGDCDFDSHQRAKSKFVRWRLESKAFKEYERYDCRKSGCPADG